LALDGGKLSASGPGHFTPRERTTLDGRLGGLQSWSAVERRGLGGGLTNLQNITSML